MSYRVEFEGAALMQLKGLPPTAFDALDAGLIRIFDLTWIG